MLDQGPFVSALAVRARARLDSVADQLVELSHAIAADPELAYEEHRTAARCADLLESAGLAVERGAYGLPTAFAARAGRADGLHVVICAELDALPGVGHACGHNIIAASGVGAGIALASVADEAGLHVTVLGTPAEESGGGKVDLIRAGALDGVDFALMVHPAPYDTHDSRGLAIEEWDVVCTGQASHSSSAPQLGRNALDGIVAGYTAIAMLRQHLAPLQQVHGIITDGGEAPNVVPERAAAAYYLRANDEADLVDLRARVRACLEGAAAATGTQVEIRQVGHALRPDRPAPGARRSVRRGLRGAGAAVHAGPARGRPGRVDGLRQHQPAGAGHARGPGRALVAGGQPPARVRGALRHAGWRPHDAGGCCGDGAHRACCRGGPVGARTLTLSTVVVQQELSAQSGVPRLVSVSAQ